MLTEGVYDIVPQRVVFGRAFDAQIAHEAERFGKSRVFAVCSASLEREAGISDRLDASLAGGFAGLFTGIAAHTPRASVMEGVRAAREAGADLLVGIGGGSVIDGVKAIQLALSEGVQTEDHLAAFARSPIQRQPGRSAGPASIRQIAVPTTLSGAEFSNLGGVMNTGAGVKEGYGAPDGHPITVIFDPELACCTPLRLWLSSAIRSVDHACEGYCSTNSFPYLDQSFLGALRLLAPSLRRSHGAEADSEARSLSQQGVWTVATGVGRTANGASHGLGYVLGSLGVPHGETSCVLLPAVLEWNRSVNGDRQTALAEALGREGMDASDAVRELVRDLGLPIRLRDVGITEDQLEAIAQKGAQHPTVLNNPRPIEHANDVMEILRLAF